MSMEVGGRMMQEAPNTTEFSLERPFNRALFMHQLVTQFSSNWVLGQYRIPQLEDNLVFDPFSYQQSFQKRFREIGLPTETLSPGSRYLQTVAMLLSIDTEIMSPHTFQAIGDALDTNWQPKITKNISRLIPGDYSYQDKRAGRAAAFSSVNQEDLAIFKSLNLSNHDFRSAYSFSSAFSYMFLNAAAKEGKLATSQTQILSKAQNSVWIADFNQAQRDVEYQARVKMVSHFLKFGKRGMNKSEVLSLFTATFDALGLYKYLAQLQDVGLRTYFPGVYAELFAGLAFQEEGYDVTFSSQYGDAMGVDYIIKKDREVSYVQVKGAKNLKVPVILHFNHKAEAEKIRQDLFGMGFSPTQRRNYKDSLEGVLEVMSAKKGSSGVLYLVPYRDAVDRIQNR